MYAHNEAFARFVAYYGATLFWTAMSVLGAGLLLLH
jgi:hypothetical protein